MKKNWSAALCVVALTFVACLAPHEFPRLTIEQPLPDGLYIVCVDGARCKNKTKNVFMVATSAPAADDVAQVVIDTGAYVPLLLQDAPTRAIGDDGRTRLSVTLAANQTRALADFTRAHLGERVAIVLHRRVVTMHKIRTVIDNGKMQITRCGPDAAANCDVIFSKLKAHDTF